MGIGEHDLPHLRLARHAWRAVEGAKRFNRIGRAPRRARRFNRDIFLYGLQDRKEQRRLVGELVIQGAATHLRFGQNCFRRGPFVAMSGEQMPRRCDDFRPGEAARSTLGESQ